MSRIIKYSQSILEATDQALERDPNVYLMGLGVPDPKGIFGTTVDLHKKYGDQRVFDIPCSENGMTGIAIGSAITGKRPILTHQRLDFSLLSLEQIINQAAKWHYMFNGKMKVPLVIRMIIGRGWGQGPQHSQALHACFAHIPGLKVVLPSTAYDAKGLLAASIEDNNPVIFLEHRWLHNVTGEVPEEYYTLPIGEARVARPGTDITIVATSYMLLEALRVADELAEEGINCEVIDLRSILPLDMDTVLSSVEKTGKLVIADIGTKSYGISAEIITRIVEKSPSILSCSPARVSLPDHPTPTSPKLAETYYPRSEHIKLAVEGLCNNTQNRNLDAIKLNPRLSNIPLDIPDPSFTGPF